MQNDLRIGDNLINITYNLCQNYTIQPGERTVPDKII